MLQTMFELITSMALADGVAGLLPRLALSGTILLGVAWTLATLARRRSAAVRHLIWSLSLVALLVLPLAATLPGPSVPVLPAKTAQQAAPEPSPQGSPATDPATAASPSRRSTAAVPVTTDGAAVVRPEPLTSSRWSASRVVGAVYGAGVVLALLPLAAGLVSARRLARSTAPLETEPAWAELLSGLRRRLGITRAVSLRRATGLAVPVTWGWRRPVVLLPEEAAEWSAAERRNALIHELAHIARGDWAVQLGVRVACAVHWFHPLAWLAARRVAFEAEQACDDRVLLGGAEETTYADQLVFLARRARHGWAASYAAIAMARPGDLTRRVAALLDERTLRGVLRRRSVIVSGAAALLLTMTLAPVRLVRAAAGTPYMSGRLDQLLADEHAGDAQEPQRPKGYATGERPLAGPQATPLMRAAAAGDVRTVERLLDGGAAADRVVPGQGTALILAATAGADDVVAALLARGADPNLADPAGNRWTNLPRTALNGAARAGCVESARLLLDHGARVDAAPEGDATPLMAAARYGHLDVARFLVERGADVDARVHGDGTPLIEAARDGHAAIVELLLERGATPDVAVSGDGNPLIMAAAGGHLEIARTLLDAGADPNVWVSGDEGPLYHAVERSDRAMARLLLARGADPTQSWPGDGNALAVAGENGDREMLELLLAHAPRRTSDTSVESEPDGDPDIDVDADVETDDGDPDAWLIVDGAGHRLIVPEGTVVEFDGTGRLEFPAGPVSVLLPAGHRLVVDGETMREQAVITGDPDVRIVARNGTVAWRLRMTSWSALERPGTRIEDTDASRGARIDTSGDRMRFYLAVDGRGRETFFEPEA